MERTIQRGVSRQVMTQYRFHSHIAKVVPPKTLSQFIGPLENCAQTIWGQLVDFENWSSWLPGIDTVTRLDTGNTGRGSRLELQGKLLRHDWVIAHWDPGNRVDFEITAAGKRLGYSYRINGAGDSQHAELRLNMEFEFSGPSSLFSVLLAAMEKRRGEQRFHCFITHMKSLSG